MQVKKEQKIALNRFWDTQNRRANIETWYFTFDNLFSLEEEKILL